MPEPGKTIFEQTLAFFRSFSYPRAVGTWGEARAQYVIKGAFSKLNAAKVEEQEFSVSRAYMAGLLNIIHPIIGICVIIAFLLNLYAYYLAAFIFSIILIGITMFNRQIIWTLQFPIQKKGKQYPTKNIITTMEPTESPKQTIVFLAHYDSISHVLSPVIESLGYLAGFLLSFFFAIHSSIFAAISFFTNSTPCTAMSLIWGIPVAIIAFLELLNRKGNDTDGVLDDASGIAQMYYLAKGLESNPLKNTKVIFVATGAEELGDSGAHYFIEKNKMELQKETTRFIVVDSIGVEGQNTIIHAIGLPQRHFCPSLEAIIRENLLPYNTPLKFLAIPPLLQVASDHVPVERAGYEFIWFASTSFVYHSRKDNWDMFNQEKFRKIIEFIEQIVRIADRQPKTL